MAVFMIETYMVKPEIREEYQSSMQKPLEYQKRESKEFVLLVEPATFSIEVWNAVG